MISVMRVIIYGLTTAISKPVHRFFSAPGRHSGDRQSNYQEKVVYIIAKYRIFALTGLFAGHVNPYHLGVAFTARPGIIKRPMKI